MAKAAGVSTATVSYVLNRRGIVSPAVQKRVLSTIKALDYTPRRKARKGKAHIAVVMQGTQLGVYDAGVLAAVANALLRRGMLLEIVPIDESDILRKSTFDGAVTILHSTGQSRVREKCREIESRLPVVNINDPVEGTHCVHSDERQGVHEAVSLLARCGHRRIGLLIANPARSAVAGRRLAAYREAVQELGLDRDPGLIRERTREPGLFDSMAGMTESNPTALIALGEQFASRVNYGLHILGKKVPEDMSLITSESPDVSPYLPPPNTTVAQDMQRLGELAVRELERIVNGTHHAERHLMVPYKLIRRESVKDLATT